MLYLTFTEPNGDQAGARSAEAPADRAGREPAAESRRRCSPTGCARSTRATATSSRPITPEALGALKLDVDAPAYTRSVRQRSRLHVLHRRHLQGGRTSRRYIERYIASLPSTGKRGGHSQAARLSIPGGGREDSRREGTRAEKRDGDHVLRRRGSRRGRGALANAASDVLEIRLRDLLREALGSTYSVSVDYSNSLPEHGYGTISHRLRQRAGERRQARRGRARRSRSPRGRPGPTAEECAKVREQYRQDRWRPPPSRTATGCRSLQASHLLGRAPETVAARRDRIERITPAKVHEAARKYFPAGRYTVAILMPETGGGAAGTAPAPAPRP